MTGLCFVDTNVLIYALSPNEALKQARAREWLGELRVSGHARFSVQVLQEFYSVATAKARPALPHSVAVLAVRALWSLSPIAVDAALLDAAWAIEERYSISWWDALIVAAAQLQGCRYLLTEDLQHGQRFGEVEIVNPFVVKPSAVA